MNPPRCPDCGTERDASSFKRDGKCVAVQCIACETSHPCCPECRTPKIKRADNQLDLECVFCEGTFPDPEIPRSSRRELSQKEIHFLMEVGQGLSASDSFRYRKGRRSIRMLSPQRYEEEQGAEFSELGYINSELRRFVVLPNLLGWTKAVRSNQATIEPDLLAVSYVSGNLLADNSSFNHPTEIIQYRRAKQLLDVIVIAAGLPVQVKDSILQREQITFRKQGKRFYISVKGKEFTNLQCRAGFYCMQILLLHPGKEIKALQVEEFCQDPDIQRWTQDSPLDLTIGGIKDDFHFDRKTEKQILKEIERLKGLIEASTDPEQTAQLKETLIEGRKYLEDGTGQFHKRREFSKEDVKARQRVRRNIGTALEFLRESGAKELIDLAAQLNRDIAKGKVFSYNPDPNKPPHWVLF